MEMPFISCLSPGFPSHLKYVFLLYTHTHIHTHRGTYSPTQGYARCHTHGHRGTYSHRPPDRHTCIQRNTHMRLHRNSICTYTLRRHEHTQSLHMPRDMHPHPYTHIDTQTFTRDCTRIDISTGSSQILRDTQRDKHIQAP